ncbi:hypothetical protein PR048_016533 [Dryococelus australis]|uniref:Uncharacterized protein n=1 Tax=Dryococelus australis TaxID=614101 RepID=A0ABQ9HK61_9NEOP|nr:hypothetical protein PR048_016533 [Dryococelus australis]
MCVQHSRTRTNHLREKFNIKLVLTTRQLNQDVLESFFSYIRVLDFRYSPAVFCMNHNVTGEEDKEYMTNDRSEIINCFNDKCITAKEDITNIQGEKSVADLDEEIVTVAKRMITFPKKEYSISPCVPTESLGIYSLADILASAVRNVIRYTGEVGGSRICDSHLSTVCKRIMEKLGQADMDHTERQVVCISQDSFYRELTPQEKIRAEKGNFNFDHPVDMCGRHTLQAGVEPVDKEMARGTELSDFDKGVIVGCHLSGLSSRVIARKRPTDFDISEEQLHISPMSRQAIKLSDSGGGWTVATGHWSSGNRFFGVMCQGLHYSGPMDVYWCGFFSGNGFCRSGYNALVRRQQCLLIGLARQEIQPQSCRTSLGQIGSPGEGSSGAAKIHCSTHGMVARGMATHPRGCPANTRREHARQDGCCYNRKRWPYEILTGLATPLSKVFDLYMIRWNYVALSVAEGCFTSRLWRFTICPALFHLLGWRRVLQDCASWFRRRLSVPAQLHRHIGFESCLSLGVTPMCETLSMGDSVRLATPSDPQVPRAHVRMILTWANMELLDMLKRGIWYKKQDVKQGLTSQDNVDKAAITLTWENISLMRSKYAFHISSGIPFKVHSQNPNLAVVGDNECPIKAACELSWSFPSPILPSLEKSTKAGTRVTGGVEEGQHSQERRGGAKGEQRKGTSLSALLPRNRRGKGITSFHRKETRIKATVGQIIIPNLACLHIPAPSTTEFLRPSHSETKRVVWPGFCSYP